METLMAILTFMWMMLKVFVQIFLFGLVLLFLGGLIYTMLVLGRAVFDIITNKKGEDE